MHLTVRQYAAEKLAISEEAWETQERHCQYYSRFLQQREEALKGEHPKEALEAIDVELGNVRLAWSWAVAQGKVPEIERSLDSLYHFYKIRSWFQEGRRAFETAVEALHKQADRL